MPAPYPPGAPPATFHAQISIPTDGDSVNAASVVAFQQLADRTQELKNTNDSQATALGNAAYKNQAQSFVEPQTVQLDNAEVAPALTLNAPRPDVPLLASTAGPGDHPDYTGNKWRLVARWKRAGGLYAYIYTGSEPGTDGAFLVSINAYYDIDDEEWVQEDTGAKSCALILFADVLRYCVKAAGSGPWATWSATLDGTFEVAGIVCAGVTAGTFAAADDGFLYETPQTRETVLPIQRAIPSDSTHVLWVSPEWKSAGSFVAGLVYVVFPIELPHGAELTKIEVLHAQTSDTLGFGTHEPDFTSGAASAPEDTSGWSHTAVGPQQKSTKTVSVTISKDKSYWLRWSPSAANEELLAARVTWTDPGPRNH